MKLFASFVLAVGLLAGFASSIHAAEGRASYAARLGALKSSAVLILDAKTRRVLYQKNARAALPIASLTKLMTALVVLEAKQDMAQILSITTGGRRPAQVFVIAPAGRHPPAAHGHAPPCLDEFGEPRRLRAGAQLPGRHAPVRRGDECEGACAGHAQYAVCGADRPVARERRQSRGPGKAGARRASGIRSIRRYSTDRHFSIRQGRDRTDYHNTNRLTANPGWKIRLQKTGYIAEAGRCMILHAAVKGRPTVMVFLDAQGKYSRAADANSVRSWLSRLNPWARR